jgi:hypothetical protein
VTFPTNEVFMTEAEILATVRQLASDLRDLAPGCKVTQCEAYKMLESQPGKGGPLMQWFNKETDQQRKNIISDILGHFARAAYQQKPEFNQNAADQLMKLCDRLHPRVVAPPVADPFISEVQHSEKPQGNAADPVPAEEASYQRAIELWNAGGVTWASIAEQVGADASAWKAFSQAVKRYALKNQHTLRIGRGAKSAPHKRD